MRNIPKDIQECAQRIAAKCGESVEAVINQYLAAVKKAKISISDFLLKDGDISLSDVSPSTVDTPLRGARQLDGAREKRAKKAS